VDYLVERLDTDARPLVVDSLRTVRQTEPLLLHVPGACLIYLDAHAATRRQRYGAASESDPVKRSAPFDEAMNHPTEQQVIELRSLADLVIDTDDLAIGDIADAIKTLLRR
jgi:RNase adaptor protein for sRNA GlmZ degradation